MLTNNDLAARLDELCDLLEEAYERVGGDVLAPAVRAARDLREDANNDSKRYKRAEAIAKAYSASRHAAARAESARKAAADATPARLGDLLWDMAHAANETVAALDGLIEWGGDL